MSNLKASTIVVRWVQATCVFLAGCVAYGSCFANPLSLETTKGNLKIYDRSVALVIGESKYKYFTPLDTVPSEVGKLADALRAQGFDDVRVKLNLDGSELGQAIKNFLNEPASRDTRMLIYYAGHGVTDDTYTGYIVPTNNPLEGQPHFRDYLVSMEDISNWSKLSKAKHILFVFDSCFSGAVFLTRSNLKPSELFLQDADRPVRQFITSGSADETVPAKSVFVYRFIEGLNGQADVFGDGVVTANELGYWLKMKIAADGRQTPQYGSSPLPEFRRGDMLFKVSNQTSTPKLIPYAAGRERDTRSAEIRAIGNPEAEGMKVFNDIAVTYYQKAADKDRVKSALNAAKIPYVTTRATLPERFETNAIACGPDIPVDAIQIVALNLIKSGVRLNAIIPYKYVANKPKRIEILSTQAHTGRGLRSWSGSGITEEQVQSLKSCPRT